MPRADSRRWPILAVQFVLRLGRPRVGWWYGTDYWPGGQIEFICPGGPSIRFLFVDRPAKMLNRMFLGEPYPHIRTLFQVHGIDKANLAVIERQNHG